ncbi:MAG TPA: MBL fold metallo-hydrolase [Phenylobacterium sp.]|nr:MBL fold metallo-hydrolase [Phenylobacterium sp.]
MTPKLTFHGAAGCVTGSCYRLQTPGGDILIDCGMFQGPKTLKELNYDRFPFDAGEIVAVLLSHAHIDHSGLLPKLMKAGFEGPIYATAATRDLCAIMLTDSGGIQESEVEHLNRRNQRRGRPLVQPIYRAADAPRTLKLFRKVKLGETVQVAPGVTAVYWEAGHILGATSIEVTVESDEGPIRILFSGDFGPGGRDYSPDPQSPSGVDHLVIESTYGDRDRQNVDPESRRRMLAKELNDAYAAGGPLLIPAFAVERTQELIADILTLMDSGEAPEGDVFLDSPLAIKACKVFVERGWNSDTGWNPFRDVRASKRLQFLEKPWDSDRLDPTSGWRIIMAGSGMCDAGRIRNHLKRWLWEREATVLITGFQAMGTLGRLLAEGAREVRIQGEDVTVEARIRTLDVYSGHADADRLAAWAVARQPVGGTTFIVHGEPSAEEALRTRLVDAGFNPERIEIPVMDASYKLRRAQVELTEERTPRLGPHVATALDWHNARAQLLIDLDARLSAAPDDAAREALLADLSRTLAVDMPQGGRRRERME